MKKTIILQLNPQKTSRHLVFDIELSKDKATTKDYDTLQDIENFYTLSICGTTRKDGCCCQMQDEIIKYKNRVKKEDINKFNFIMDIWYKYHLNELQSGTKKQIDFINDYENKNNIKLAYSQKVRLLKDNNIYDDRGIKYGYVWLAKQIPNDIIQKIINL